MKLNFSILSFFSLVLFSLISVSSFGSEKCALEAKMHARLHVASENKVSVGQVKAPQSFYHSTSNKVHYYGVIVIFDGFSQSYNVGLNAENCKLAHINLVTR
jgi:hypothetical protein